MFIYMDGQAPVNTDNVSLIRFLYDGDDLVGFRFECSGGHSLNWRIDSEDECKKVYRKILKLTNAQEIKQ